LVGRDRVVAVADRHLEAEVAPRIERRIDVDEVDLAAKLREQTRHHQLVVAPDQTIACAVQARASRRIDHLDPLERHRERSRVDRSTHAPLVVLAFPDQLGPHAAQGMRMSRPPRPALGR
jgi:hypothetical protein